MSVEFSAKISMLRKEKQISQRQASQDLGISQALLSHYEKGIRECNLDFVKTVALYYGVSADFLLGLSENKQGISDLHLTDDLDTDAEFSAKTLLRAMIYLSECAERNGESDAAFYCDFFSLCIKKYSAMITGNTGKTKRLADLSTEMLTDSYLGSRPKKQNLSTPPRAYETIRDNGDLLIEDAVRNIME